MFIGGTISSGGRKENERKKPCLTEKEKECQCWDAKKYTKISLGEGLHFQKFCPLLSPGNGQLAWVGLLRAGPTCNHFTSENGGYLAKSRESLRNKGLGGWLATASWKN